MVVDSEIRASNTRIDNDSGPHVAAFFGGTSGVGKLTTRALVGTGISIKIYLVGRKSSEAQSQIFISELNQLNPNAQIVWIEGEISLLAEVKRICEIIKSKESQLDLLFMTAGYAPFQGRQETSEGIGAAQSLEYYSRIACILHLLPLLHKSDKARVISVLGGGLETKWIDADDIDQRKPGAFGGVKSQTHYVKLNSIALDKLAEENPTIVFIHAWPGWVNTGNVNRSFDTNTWLGWLADRVLGSIVAFFSINDDIAAQRSLFECTSAAFGGRGVPWTGKVGLTSRETPNGGVFLVNANCDCTPNAKVLAKFRRDDQAKVWKHTEQIMQPFL